MTRHAEMERPDEVQEAEFAREALLITRRADRIDYRRAFVAACVAMGIPLHKREPYSRLRERLALDPTYRPRHMNHRAEVAG